MNRSRPLPPRDRSHRNRVARGQSGLARPAAGALGLVGRASHPPERATPPGVNPAARDQESVGQSTFDRVSALPVVALAGRHGQAHLLSHGPGQESPEGMRLPTSGFEQFPGGHTALAPKEIQDLGRFTAFAGNAGFPALGFLRACGLFLGWGGLLPHLPLLGRNGRVTWRTCALAGSFGMRARGRRGGIRIFFGNCRVHVFSLRGDHRGHDMDHSIHFEKQGNSAQSAEGNPAAERSL